MVTTVGESLFRGTSAQPSGTKQISFRISFSTRYTSRSLLPECWNSLDSNSGPRTDKSVNVKALLVSGSYAEAFEGELIIVSKINLRADIEPVGGLQKPDRFIDRREECDWLSWQWGLAKVLCASPSERVLEEEVRMRCCLICGFKCGGTGRNDGSIFLTQGHTKYSLHWMK
jgi:hypothetical protein